MENNKPKRRSRIGVHILGTSIGVVAAGGAGFGIAAAAWYDPELKAEHQIVIEQTLEQTHGYKVEVSPKTTAKKGDKVTFTVTSTANGVTYQPKAIRITSLPKKEGEEAVSSDYPLTSNGDKSYTAEVTILYTSDMNVELMFDELQDWVVNFDSDGAQSYPQQYVPRGQKVTKPVDPSKTGYTFKYWYAEGESEEFNFNKAIEGNITLKAKWEIHSHDVHWIVDGVETKTDNVNYGDTPNYGSVPTKDPTAQYKYVFKGWSPEIVPMPDNDVTYTAQFEEEIQSYTINFVTNYGSVPSVSLNYGQKVTKPDLTHIGYTLEGWYTDEAHSTKWDFSHGITGNLTLYAKWVLNTQNVSFDLAGGSGSYTPYQTSYGLTLDKPSADPTKDGCNFKYWTVDGKEWIFKNDSQGRAATEVTKDITLTAFWENKTYYTVTFDAQNGSETTVQTIEAGQAVTAPTIPTWTGHTLKGWYDAPTGGNLITSFPSALDGNKKYYAQWTTDKYNVTFHVGDTTSTVEVEHGSKVQRPENPTPPTAGTKFVNWVTTDGGSTLFNFDTAITAATDVYAKFTACEVISIAVTTLPKTEFEATEDFSSAGMVVTATLEDGSTTDVSASATVDSSAFVKGTPGTYPISVKYTNTSGTVKSTSYNVTVKKVAVTGITVTNKTVDVKVSTTATTIPNAVVAPTTATNQNIKLSYINGSLFSATRDTSTGNITITAGTTIGTGYIIATTVDGGFSDVITVNVYNEFTVDKSSGTGICMSVPDTIKSTDTTFTITRNSTSISVSDPTNVYLNIDGTEYSEVTSFDPYTLPEGQTVVITLPAKVTTSFAIWFMGKS